MRKALNGMILGVTIGGAVSATAGDAAACIDGNTSVEIAMESVACNKAFIDWTHNSLMKMAYWEDWGEREPCSSDLPYGKVMGGVAALAIGLSLDATRPSGSLQMHGAFDYLKSVHAHGDGGAWHEKLYYVSAEDSGVRARYTGDKIQLACGLFNWGQQWNRQISQNPAALASTLVHETWHAWQRYPTRKISAADNSGGKDNRGHTGWGGCSQCKCPAATQSNQTCDYYYFHFPTAFTYHDMLNYVLPSGSPPYRFHSVYQAQFEATCDIALFSRATVPNSVKMFARMWSNNLMETRMANLPSWRCGVPGMVSGRRVCRVQTDCPSGQACVDSACR